MSCSSCSGPPVSNERLENRNKIQGCGNPVRGPGNDKCRKGGHTHVDPHMHTHTHMRAHTHTHTHTHTHARATSKVCRVRVSGQLYECCEFVCVCHSVHLAVPICMHLRLQPLEKHTKSTWDMWAGSIGTGQNILMEKAHVNMSSLTEMVWRLRRH